MATPPGRPRDSLCYPNQPTTHNHRNTFPSRGDIRHSHQCRRKNREANDNGTERAYSVTTAKILSPHLPIFHQRISSWRRGEGEETHRWWNRQVALSDPVWGWLGDWVVALPSLLLLMFTFLLLTADAVVEECWKNHLRKGKNARGENWDVFCAESEGPSVYRYES